MKKLIALFCFAAMTAAPAFAAGQQDKMKGCNKEAKAEALKGDERKAFMKKCLSKDYVLKGEAAAKPEAAARQDKMKTCSADAKSKSLKGDERKEFMKTCLKN